MESMNAIRFPANSAKFFQPLRYSITCPPTLVFMQVSLPFLTDICFTL